MEKQKKFQNQKLNSEDHKEVARAAGGLKKGMVLAGILAPIVGVVKKYGIKQISAVAVKTIFKQYPRLQLSM